VALDGATGTENSQRYSPSLHSITRTKHRAKGFTYTHRDLWLITSQLSVSGTRSERHRQTKEGLKCLRYLRPERVTARVYMSYGPDSALGLYTRQVRRVHRDFISWASRRDTQVESRVETVAKPDGDRKHSSWWDRGWSHNALKPTNNRKKEVCCSKNKQARVIPARDSMVIMGMVW
jgi:hypothetical protein